MGGGLVRAKNFGGREKGDGREMNREGKELKFTACICDIVQGKKKKEKKQLKTRTLLPNLIEKPSW